jgi:Rhodopirellula transposase DDE domain
LVINADNGPENSGVRTQWLRRLLEFSAGHNVEVQLACYPPYHSKYNPIERVFGVLENYWNGDPLCSVEKALAMAEAMTYKGVHPTASLHEGGIKGVRLKAAAMRVVEKAAERLQGVGKWFVRFKPEKARMALKNLQTLLVN